jgi:hypothetical protein
MCNAVTLQICVSFEPDSTDESQRFFTGQESGRSLIISAEESPVTRD